MTCIHVRLTVLAVIAAGHITATSAAFAQEASRSEGSPFGLFGRIFGGSERFSPPPPQPPDPGSAQLAQGPGTELVTRLERLEGQIRQLTGAIEQLQHRNQQLEGQLKRFQDDTEFRFQEIKGGARTAPAPTRPTPNPPNAPAGNGRRGDAFDPTNNPTAPGAPRTLGSAPANASDHEPPPIGAPGGRTAGAPLDLSTLSTTTGTESTPSGAVASTEPNAPPRNPGGGGSQVATLPPSESPKDSFDLAYGYLVRKDYALADDGFRNFLKKFPNDRLTPDAQYWLAESLFQRQRFRDAAEAFLNVSTKYEAASKAPEALLRLGQALAALGEKEAACASLGEVLRKYPRASVSVRQGVDREQKRVRC
jgi:tol-pal system protein YbgF